MASYGHFFTVKSTERTGLKNIFSYLSFDPEIKDGIKIQNGDQKRKNLIFASKWPIFSRFQKTISRVLKKPLSLII
jgi:hypothetical protein